MIRFLLFLSCLALPLWAQIELGSIVGQVTDPQNAPVAGAVVEFRSLTTNVKRVATSFVPFVAVFVSIGCRQHPVAPP